MRVIPFSLCGCLLALGLAWPAQAQEAALVPTPATPAAAPVAPAATTLPSAPTASPVLTRADLEAWLDGYLPYALDNGDIAGAVVVVVKDGQVLLEKGYGYSDIEKRAPVDPQQTLFRPGSVSKLFTWTAVMQLVGQGKLDLDADVNQCLPRARCRCWAPCSRTSTPMACRSPARKACPACASVRWKDW